VKDSLSDKAKPRSNLLSSAYAFVVVFGIVSLFSDMTHEGARSVTGPFLSSLGLSAAAVGIIAGLGEFVGYALRFASGYISDKTKRYWLVTEIGYAVNLLAVPLLAIAGRWEIAALLMILERAGRAIRNPARDAMLSHATTEMGRGKGFGIHEALDQIGATTGPLIIAGVLLLGVSLRKAFAFLLIPAVAALVILTFARLRYPHPETFETTKKEQFGVAKFPRAFWLYLAASSLVAIGFVDYPLIAYHLQKSDLFKDSTIAIYYSVAMGIDALAALLFGRLYDKKGIWALVISTAISLPFPLFAFQKSPFFPLIGILLWGIGMGAQESIMRAAIADFASREKRATAYGFFNAIYGTFWFAGSAIFGLIYDGSITAAIVFSLVPQLAAIPFFVLSARRRTADAAGQAQ
jgi:predicted MFS family arabinose efflux permease